MKFDKNTLKNYQEFIIAAVIILLLICYGLYLTFTMGAKCFTNFVKLKESNASLVKLNKQMKDQETAAAQEQDKLEKLKPIFEQDGLPTDSIASFGSMFEDIINYVKVNGLLLRSVEYTINPEGNDVYKSFPNDYNVCDIKFYLAGTYLQLLSFFKDLETYSNYLNVSHINIIPFEDNREYIVANITISIYSKKPQ